MILDNDNLIIWRETSHMILNGEVMEGELVITTRNVYFIQVDDKRFLRKERTEREIWDLHINNIKDINIHEVKGHKAPYIRIRYNENDAFFTFPDKDLEQVHVALIIFINHSRTISRLVDNVKNIGENLDARKLEIGKNPPKLISGLPSKVDEECFQCGKPMMEDEFDQLVQDIRECLTCTHTE